MTLATRLFRTIFLAALWLLLTIFINISSAQGSLTSTREAFITYRCEFEAATNTAKIYAALNDANGLPMPRDRYSITVTTSNPVQAIPPQRVALTLLPRRQPLRMVIVLDTTDTMPIKEVVTAISTQLAPQLDVNDQVAFIRADSQISPITPYYIDKNRLINEHMLDLQPGSGDNRVYEGLITAIDNLQQNRDVRQAVLFITDSGPREGVDQTSADVIATRARNAKVQIYPIGIHLYDDPSDTDLLTLATTSQGYAWIYDEPSSSNAAAGVAVANRLDQLIDVLNSEILISVDMRGQVPDASGLVTFDVALDMTNGIKLADQIACPIEVLNHSIQFTPGTPTEITTSNPVDLSVTAFSDLSQDETSIVFRVNDEPQQSGDVSTFTFNTAAFPPGTYSVIAQLRDNNENILATTERPITIITQQKLNLTESQGSLADLDKPLTLEAQSNPDIVLPDALFRINAAGAPELDYPLGQGRASFQGGRASLGIQSLRDEVERLFPDVKPNDVFEIRAYVPGAGGAAAPVQAESNVRTFTYVAVPLVPTTAPDTTNTANNTDGGSTSTAQTVTTDNTSAPVAAMQALIARTPPLVLGSFILTVILLLVNIILMPRVQRQRIRRLIHNPDAREMSNRLMAATVRRDGMKQTLVLTKRTVTLGRGTGNDLNLGDDTNISREHGVIMWRRGKWWYSNRKPRLRARIDGRRYVGFVLYELEHVTEIEIGDAKVFFHSSTQQDVSELTKTNL